MKPLNLVLIFVIILALFLNWSDWFGGSVVITSNQFGAQMTTTDAFGNKKTCETIITGSNTLTTCK